MLNACNLGILLQIAEFTAVKIGRFESNTYYVWEFSRKKGKGDDESRRERDLCNKRRMSPSGGLLVYIN